MLKKIYLAARYSRHPEMQIYALALQARGYYITSRWIWGNHQVQDDGVTLPGTDQQVLSFALEDWQDVTEADVLLNFTEPPRSSPNRGGRHVELGIGLGQNKRVIVIGPRENIFHCLPQIEHYVIWADCLTKLEIEARQR